MDTVILRNKRPARMVLTSITSLQGTPIVLEPQGSAGDEVIAPAFVQSHPDVVRFVEVGWLEVAPGPANGEHLGKVDKGSAEALGVPPGDGPVVPADPLVGENVFLGDPSNPLPPDMSTGADHVDEPSSPDDSRRSRRKKHE